MVSINSKLQELLGLDFIKIGRWGQVLRTALSHQPPFCESWLDFCGLFCFHPWCSFWCLCLRYFHWVQVGARRAAEDQCLHRVVTGVGKSYGHILSLSPHNSTQTPVHWFSSSMEIVHFSRGTKMGVSSRDGRFHFGRDEF